MTREEIDTASALAFIRICAEVGTSPADLSDDARDIHALSFSAGASWAMGEALKSLDSNRRRVLEA